MKMIQEYFKLQFKMLSRKMTDLGIHPLFAWIGIVVLFLVFTLFLFSKTIYAAPIYTLIALTFVYRLDQKERTDFLKQVLKQKDYFLLRILENVLILLPFVITLLLKSEFVFAILSSIIGGLMAFFSVHWSPVIVLPTPFRKWPFEFVVGFRKSFYLILLDFFLLIMAVKHDNYNLGLFTIIFLTILFLSFYSKAENDYYVWNFSSSPPHFLFRKLQLAAMNASILFLPIAVILLWAFEENFYNTILFLGLSYIFLGSIVLAKYASYPLEIQLPYTVLLVLSVFFPPFLIVLIPFLYWKALQHLNEYLV